jgi:TIR domain
MAKDTTAQPIRVFISYSHTSPQHEKWVESLATFLRNNGVDARLDVWHLRYGMDLAQFMTNELNLADRVIIVSDERYAEKADGRVGGVGWETMIVQGHLSRLPPDSTKYLVIVRSADLDPGLPSYLKTKFVIHWPDATNSEPHRQTLLRELYEIIKIPPLGPRPVFV